MIRFISMNEQLKQNPNYQALLEIDNRGVTSIDRDSVKEFIKHYNQLLNECSFDKIEYLRGINVIGKVAAHSNMKPISSFYQSKCSSAFSICINELERNILSSN